MFSHVDLKRRIPKQRAKTDSMTQTMLKPWFQAVRRIENPVIRTYLQCLLLLGCRRTALAALKWRDVDFEQGTLRFRDNGRIEGRLFPLTPFVASLFVLLPTKQKPYVFAADTKTKYLVEPRLAHKRALVEAGISDDLTLTGLRRAFASLSEHAGMPREIIAHLQGYVLSASNHAESGNIQRDIDSLRRYMVDYEKWILDQAQMDFSADAVP
jgi:integrase